METSLENGIAIDSRTSCPTEVLTCTATVSDTLENVTMSTSVVVENTAPTISSVSITPNVC